MRHLSSVRGRDDRSLVAMLACVLHERRHREGIENDTGVTETFDYIGSKPSSSILILILPEALLIVGLVVGLLQRPGTPAGPPPTPV